MDYKFERRNGGESVPVEILSYLVASRFITPDTVIYTDGDDEGFAPEEGEALIEYQPFLHGGCYSLSVVQEQQGKSKHIAGLFSVVDGKVVQKKYKAKGGRAPKRL